MGSAFCSHLSHTRVSEELDEGDAVEARLWAEHGITLAESAREIAALEALYMRALWRSHARDSAEEVAREIASDGILHVETAEAAYLLAYCESQRGQFSLSSFAQLKTAVSILHRVGQRQPVALVEEYCKHGVGNANDRMCNCCFLWGNHKKCGCGAAYYCGVQCQRADWDRHRPECKKKLHE